MKKEMKYEELVELLQEGRITHLQFVMNSDQTEDYLAFCESHGIEASEESAEFFFEMTAIDMMDKQLINDEDYGVWN